MTQPTFGIVFNQDDTDPRPVSPIDMSVVGLVGTAPGADASKFPLNTPVQIFSSDPTALTALGDTGTLIDSINLLNAQLDDFQISAKVVIIRVEEAGTDAETIANILGDAGDQTGLFALLTAGPVLGVIPRLIGVPGYTHQQFAGVDHVQMSNAGNYTVAPTVTFAGGSPIRPASAHAVLTGTSVSVVIDDPGFYQTAPTVSFAGGTGNGAVATAVLDELANPVCAALPGILSKLIAHAVIEGPGTSSQADKNWRETLNDLRLIPVDAWVKVFEGNENVTKPGVGAILGIAVRRDYEKGGIPGHSWANQPVRGIVGPARNINFSLTDGATDGQDLLANNIGVVLRGELGVETAIANSGFVFVGTDNAGDDALWPFYNQYRMRDYIHLSFLKALRYYLGKFNLTGQTIQAVLNTMSLFLRDLKADEHILGYKVGFEPDKNSPENLRAGHFRCYFAAEEPAVLRLLTIDSRRDRQALVNLMNELSVSLGDLSSVQ